MKIQICDQIFEYTYESLTPEIDDAFIKFYQLSLMNDLDVSLLDTKYLPEVEDISFDYIKSHSDTETTRKYFLNLRFIWSLLDKKDRLKDAQWFCERILQRVELFEQHQGLQIHKGPMYYFWGGTALKSGEIDKGFFLMHAAYDEDIRVNQPQPTPALKFVSLNSLDRRQYFGFLVDVYVDYLKQFFGPYCSARASHLNLNDFTQSFLESNPSPDIVFSFTHTLARLRQLSYFPKSTIHSDFSGQYKLNLLFDLVLVVENALRIKHPDNGKKLFFPKLAEFLATSPLLSWNLKDGNLGGYVLGEANKDYDKCLLALLDGTFIFNHTISNQNLESDLAIAYLIRNHGAHHLKSLKTVTIYFDKILQSLFNVLFLVVETKYT